MKLTQGIYARLGKDKPFGLRCDQMRCPELCHNAGWFNLAGEKLGFGDLSAEDFVRIAAELGREEVFLVIPESASHWDLQKNLPGADPWAPGTEYVLDNVYWAVLPGYEVGTVYSESDDMRGTDEPVEWNYRGMKAFRVGRGWIRRELELNCLIPEQEVQPNVR
jgi:hypothetical protein